MKYIDVAKEISGVRTLKNIEEKLKVNRARAIYLIYKLREMGYVITKRTSKGKRVYYISPKYASRGTSYIDIINKYAPTPGVQILARDPHYVHGKEISAEEAIIYAIKKKEVRYIIASLGLFRGIKDWHYLYKLAKEENLLREIGALYDLARTVLKKLQKMPKRFFNLALPKKNDRFRYIIDKFSSDNYKNIEKKWKVYIPLNYDDLEEYRR